MLQSGKFMSEPVAPPRQQFPQLLDVLASNQWQWYAALNTAILVLLPFLYLGIARISIALGHDIAPFGPVFGDPAYYYKWVSRLFFGDENQVLAYPYPPLSLVLLTAPRVLATSLSRYVVLFAAEMALLNALILALIIRTCRESSMDSTSPLRWYTACMPCLGLLVLWRFDIAVALLTFWGCVEWRRRPVLASSIFAAGTLVKVVPVLAFCVLLAQAVRQRANWKLAARAVTVFAVLCVVATIVWLAAVGIEAGSGMLLHAHRGLEVGSTYASALMVWGKATGEPVSVDYNPACLCAEITTLGPAAQLMTTASTFILAGAFVWFAIWAIRGKLDDPFLSVSAALMLACTTFKVLSPQYLIWLPPFLAVLRGPGASRIRAAFLAACVLTSVLYSSAFSSLTDMEDWAVAGLVLRNGLLVYCCVKLLRQPGRPDPAIPVR